MLLFSNFLLWMNPMTQSPPCSKDQWNFPSNEGERIYEFVSYGWRGSLWLGKFRVMFQLSWSQVIHFPNFFYLLLYSLEVQKENGMTAAGTVRGEAEKDRKGEIEKYSKLVSQEPSGRSLEFYPPSEPFLEYADLSPVSEPIWLVLFLGNGKGCACRWKSPYPQVFFLQILNAFTSYQKPTSPDALHITSSHKWAFTHSLRHKHGEGLEMIWREVSFQINILSITKKD